MMPLGNPMHSNHPHRQAMPFPFFAMPDLGEMVGIELQDAAKFAEGFINEFSDKNGLHALKDCVQSFHSVEGELQEVVDDFKTLSPAKIYDGVKTLIHLVTDLPGDLKVCETVQGDIKTITTWGEGVISHPTQIMQNVIENISDIMKEIPKAESDMSAGNYTVAGGDTADVVIDVFGKVTTKFMKEPDYSLLFN